MAPYGKVKHRQEVLLGRRAYDLGKHAVAVLCMALAVVLSGQTYISLMDRIDHVHGHVHFANPLAGDVQFCTGDHDQCGTHHHHHPDGRSGHDHSHANPGHQHGDVGIVFLAAQNFVFPICAVPDSRCESESRTLASISPRGPDRPPKASVLSRA